MIRFQRVHQLYCSILIKPEIAGITQQVRQHSVERETEPASQANSPACFHSMLADLVSVSSTSFSFQISSICIFLTFNIYGGVFFRSNLIVAVVLSCPSKVREEIKLKVNMKTQICFSFINCWQCSVITTLHNLWEQSSYSSTLAKANDTVQLNLNKLKKNAWPTNQLCQILLPTDIHEMRINL